MRQLIKIIVCVALLGASLPAVWGFVPIGPVAAAPDTWQTVANGFNADNTLPFGIGSPLTTGPRNIGEEYRPNSTVRYIAVDAPFLDYFGSNGVVAVDQVLVILNHSFGYTNAIATNGIGVDGFSPTLSEMPDYSQHRNTTAFGLGLTDLKSTVLFMMTPHLGLEQADRYVWVLRQAYLPTTGTPPPACPLGEVFEVVQRNLGYVPSPLNQLPPLMQYSPYINDELYTYQIFFWPNCTIPAGSGPALFEMENFPADPFGLLYTPVSSWGLEAAGGFYTSLTRDDLAGLRYILTTNNVNFETPATGSLLVTTNLGSTSPQLTTLDLNALLAFSKTNDPALIPGSFPNVVVAGAVTNWVLVTNWSVGSFLYTPPGAPYGTQILAVFSNIVSTAYQPVFQDTFANVITNGNLANYPGIVLAGGSIVLNYSPNTVATLQTIQAQGITGAPLGTIITNTTSQTIILSNTPSGEYITIPAGQCGWRILDYPPSWSVVATTNLITQATNTFLTSSTTSNTFVGSESIVTYFTNHTYLAQAINCVNSTPTAGLYQGVEKMQFLRADFDALLGQTFRPVTNNYSMVLVNANGQLVNQNFQRVVTAPDVLITAADITPALPNFNAATLTTPNFTHDPGYAGLAGPGTINPPATFTFNKVGPVFLNGSLSSLSLTTNQFLGQTTQPLQPILAWALFDATTNPPIVFPNGTDLQNLANEMLIQVSPTPPYLPGGTKGMAYPVTPFTAAGGGFTPPFTWSATGLPGLTMVSNPDSTGTLSGTPSQTGTFDITVQLMDNVGRSVQWNYAITITH